VLDAELLVGVHASRLLAAHRAGILLEE